MTEQTLQSVEKVLRDDLARGDAVLATARPLLRHLLTSDDSGLFSDEMVARVRGMLLDVAAQLLFAEATAAEARDAAAYVAERHEPLAQALFDDTAFLAHAHSLALEAHLAERLQRRSAIDPVLTPLIHEIAASGDAAAAALAMAALAAQARFLQHCRRMELPLRELPGELFHRALELLRGQAGDADGAAADAAERGLREGYRESAGRLGLIARLVMGQGHAARALAVDHAGLAVFATALAIAAGQEREWVILSLAERQGARLALSLRAAGLDQRAALQQGMHFHPDLALPDGFEAVQADRAAALLASSHPRSGE